MPGKRIKPVNLEGMLKEWYGAEEGAAAVEQHLPRPQALSEILNSVVSRKIPAGRLKIAKVQEHWKEIAGTENARRSFPSSLTEGVLYVEVLHPAYRLALENRQVREKLLKNVQGLVGSVYCKEIKFIPAGRRGAS